jgi:ribosome-associated protein
VISTRLATTPEDRERALDVWKAARAAQGRRPNNEVVARVEDKAEHGLLLLAEDGADVVGLALAEPGTGDAELLHVEMVIVHPSQQGKGLGAQLVEAIADAGWERGFRRAEVWCTAPGFYEAAGFERSGQVKESGSVHLTAELEAPLREVVAAGEIRLGQFLKLAELVESGSEAKALIAEGQVLVNDEVETRRGRQLVPGDVVRANDRAARLVPSPG